MLKRALQWRSSFGGGARGAQRTSALRTFSLLVATCCRSLCAASLCTLTFSSFMRDSCACAPGKVLSIAVMADAPACTVSRGTMGTE